MPHSRPTTSRILKISTELNTQRCTHSVAADFLRAEHNDNTAITSQQRTVFRAGEPRHLPDLALAGSDNGHQHYGDQDNLGHLEEKTSRTYTVIDKQHHYTSYMPL